MHNLEGRGMKKVRIQIVLILVFLGNGAVLYGMMRALRYSSVPGRSVTSGLTPAAAARLAAVRSQPSLRDHVVNTDLDTSTWSGWFQSLFQKPQAQSQYFQSTRFASRVPPLGSRSFSTTPVQRSSFWEKIESFFQEKPLTMGEIDILMTGHREHDEFGKPISIFDNNDVETAKQKLGAMIDQNPEYKDAIIGKASGVNMIDAFALDSSGETYPQFTLLEGVLYPIFTYEVLGGLRMAYPSSQTIDRIKVLEYLIISKQARINPNNSAMYKQLYLIQFMESYKQLYAPQGKYNDPPRIKRAKEMLKEVFKEIDPLLEEILPDFREGLKEAQKERAEIESNPQAYEKIKQEEQDRSEYISAKARNMSNEYNRYAGDAYASYPTEFYDRVKFDEKEYQEWLRSGKHPHFFHEHRTYFTFEENDFDQEESPEYDGEPIWQLLPGLTSTSSKEEIAKAFRVFAKEYRSDLVPKDEATGIKIKKVNAAWDDYHEQLKKQKLKEQGQTVKE
jgi:hypothetical protein